MSAADGAVLEILDPGLLTTIQDRGRPTLGSIGVAPGGAADPWSLAVANALLDNAPGAAALELTLAGPTLRVLEAMTVALAGAHLGAYVVETGRTFAPGSAIPLEAGWTVAFAGRPGGGARAYLALPGGVDVPAVLGSRSTALGPGLGGLDGRPLRTGDRLRTVAGAADRRRPAATWPGPALAPGSGPLRAVAGPHGLGGATDADAATALASGTWVVAVASDRTGLRLDGPQLPGAFTGELATHGVAWGAVQAPPDRRPIVLMIDAQPTGGYPVVAVVIGADLPRLGQLAPGDPVTFELVDLPAAQRALALRQEVFHAAVAQLREAARWDELSSSAGG